MASRTVLYDPLAHQQLTEWVKYNPKIAFKIMQLVNEARINPFDGKGKPEPLKYDLKGYWSRRIDDEHRLVYRVTDSEIRIVSCKYHYS